MNLYIGNLNYNVREGDLRGVMEEYGTVASVKLITDRETRRSKGFAFVEMPNDDEAKYNPQIEMFARFKMKSSFHKTKRII